MLGVSLAPHAGFDSPLLFYVEQSAAFQELYKSGSFSSSGSQPPCPAESWIEDDLVYFVYDLKPTEANVLAPPLAVFAVDYTEKMLVLARVISSNADLTNAYVKDLYSPQEEN
jgi:hypothetical protein